MPTPFPIIQRNDAVAGLRDAQRELRAAEADADASGASHALRAQFDALPNVPRLGRQTVANLQKMMLDGVIDPREADALRDIVGQASASGTTDGKLHAAAFEGLRRAGTRPEMTRVVEARSEVRAATANLRAADEEIARYNAQPYRDQALYDLAVVACLAARRGHRYIDPCDYQYLPIYRDHRGYQPPLRIEPPYRR